MSAAANRIVWSYAMTPRYEILKIGNSPDVWLLDFGFLKFLHWNTHGSYEKNLIRWRGGGGMGGWGRGGCLSQSHIILIQGWWHTFMLCWFSFCIVFHGHISFSFKVDGTQLCCAGSPIVLCFTDTNHSQSRLIAPYSIVFHRHILFSFKADCTQLCCAGSPIVLCFTDTNHSQSRLIAPYSIVFHRHISFSFKADGTQLCCAGSPIVLCFTDISFSVKADRTLQYCVSQTHIILIQGWWRTFMLCWFSYSIVFHRHIILSQGWSHLTVLCFTGTYHSHSRLMAHSYVVLVLL